MALTISSSKGVPIETSAGTLYARYLTSENLSSLENTQEADRVGIVAIQLATSSNSDGEFEPLPDVVLHRLSENDYQLLATEIARQSGMRWSPRRPILHSFGLAIKQKNAELADERRQLHESISRSYRFLEQPTLDRLQQQLGNLNRLTASAQSLRDHWSPLFQPSSARQVFDEEQRIQAERARQSSLAEALIKAQPPELYRPAQFEETPLGKAALEGVRSTREVSQKMDALVEVVGGLNQTLVMEVLPGWIKQVERDQAAAQESFKQAAQGLWWTKWAVIVSVIVTVFATWWQVSVARDIDAGNTAQMVKSEALLREQIELQKRLLESQERTLIELKSAPGKKGPGDAADKK